MHLTIFSPIADFDAGVGGLQLGINAWSRKISEKNMRRKLPGGHMTPLVVGRLREKIKEKQGLTISTSSTEQG